jgi:RNA polymerase sigma-70 factor (ECF subfamily)
MCSDDPVASAAARPHVRCRAGIETASAAEIDVLGELYSAHRDSLVEAACGVLRDTHGAEDAVQDVFVKLIERLLPAHDITPSYLYICALNRCRDILRKEVRARQQVRLHAQELTSVANPALSDQSEYERGPDHWGSVSRFAGQLTGRQRQVVQLALSGLGVPEIARRLRVKPKTVSNHYAAAIRIMRTASSGEACASVGKSSNHASPARDRVKTPERGATRRFPSWPAGVCAAPLHENP